MAAETGAGLADQGVEALVGQDVIFHPGGAQVLGQEGMTVGEARIFRLAGYLMTTKKTLEDNLQID